MNRAVMLVLAVLSFGVLSYFCIRLEAPRIENDLMSRSREMLAANRLLAIGIGVDGRDVTLRGVQSAAIGSQAVSLVESVYGVRVARAEVQPPSSAPPPQPQVVADESAQARLDSLLGKRRVDFNAGSARLTPEGMAVLDEVANILASVPAARCAISGYTDSNGLPEENQFVSDRRAIVVKEYLISKGIAAGRMTAKGYGASKPIADNNTAEGRQKNRRIEFRLEGGY